MKYEDFRFFLDPSEIRSCSVALTHFKLDAAAIASKNNWDYRYVPLYPAVGNPKPRDTGKLNYYWSTRLSVSKGFCLLACFPTMIGSHYIALEFTLDQAGLQFRAASPLLGLIVHTTTRCSSTRPSSIPSLNSNSTSYVLELVAT